MFEICMHEQGKEEWFKAKLGIPSASHFKDILAQGRNGKSSATRKTYMLKLAAEILTGTHRKTYSNDDMARGVEQEPKARSTYEFVTGCSIVQVGFGMRDGVLASPDGLRGSEGGTEIKCVIPEVQIVTVKSGKMPPVHKAQVQGNMLVFECDWWDFISYSPLMPKPMFIKRVMREEQYIHNLWLEITKFKQELNEMVNDYRKEIIQ